MLQPGSWFARLAAVGILGGLLFVGYHLVVQPLIRTYQDNREKIVRSHDILQRYRALAAEQPALAERFASLEEEAQSRTGYLDGPSDALAAAQLQDIAAEVIEAAGGEIRSTQILPATEVEAGPPIRRTGLNLRFAVTIDSLATALFDLETAKPRLFVDQLVVISERARRAASDADSGPKLDVRMDLFGYVRQTD